MALITRVLLESKAPFHFGKRGVGLNETEIAFPADSLFSALCNALILNSGPGALSELLARFPVSGKASAEPPPFRITSLMPTTKGIDLLPMPMLIPKLAGDRVETRKQMKEIAWLSRAVFQRIVAGESIDEASDLAFSEKDNRSPYTVQNGAVWISKSEQEQLGGEKSVLWTTDIRPRVTVDRASSASAAFSSGGLYLTNTAKLKTSLYTLIRWDTEDATLEKTVRLAFEVLGGSGIGGERSYGYGQFRPQFATVVDDLGIPGGEYFTTLSPYLPQPSEREVFDERARYAITLRRGWISAPGFTHLRRPTIRMMDTGAVLRHLADSPAVGTLADATPGILQAPQSPITIYRYGLAWPVPVSTAALIDE